MSTIRVFTDGSVNPQLKIGLGAYFVVKEDEMSLESLASKVKVKRFEQTSSTRLELQTLLWALKELQPSQSTITVYTDSQNIIGLPARRERFELNAYRSKKNALLKNHALYKEFYALTDELECTFVKVQGHKRSHQKDEIDRLFALVDKASRDALREYMS